MILKCIQCETFFETKKSSRKFCNLSCSSTFNMNIKIIKSKIHKKCMWCKEDFETTKYYSYTNCCSVDCANLLRRNGEDKNLNINCKQCNKQFTVSYKRRKQLYCNLKCAKQNSWNEGLTKNDNDILRKISEVNSHKMSLRVINKKHAITGKYIHHTSDKLISKKMLCRSTYEKKYVDIMDSDEQIECYYYECIRIPYTVNGMQKWYIPDFFIKYTNGTYAIAEVKPSSMIKYGYNQNKFFAAYVYAFINNINYLIITEHYLFKNC